MKNQKGVTLVSLIITIIIILIITSATVYTSTNRFKINNLSKMYNDIELLNDKIATYYLKFGGLPIIKNTENTPIKYTFSELNFDKNINDDDNYYIIDLEAIGNITLNYGKEGFKNQNTSDDVYIINNKTHSVYYVRGIEYTDGNLYHSKKIENNANQDTVPPTKPQINIIAGDKIGENQYETNVTLEFLPGKDNWSGINKTTYSINGSKEEDINSLENYQYKINERGIYEINLKTYDNNNIYSEEKRSIYIGKIKLLEYLESTGTQYIDTEIGSSLQTKIDITVQLLNNLGMEHTGIIGGWTGTQYAQLCTNKEYNGFIIQWADKFTVFNTKDNLKHNFIFSSQDKKIILDGVSYNIADVTANSKGNMYIFAINNSGKLIRPTKMKLYNCKLYENGILLRDFIPILDQNNVACLYDKVEGKFYYNQGTGTFKTNLDE